ncbi:MAG: oxidoreductase [Gammaproteobacteria bacterium]|nr:MAG: oxidoreductase [Gammaproteobacteria bacterium]
MGLVGSETYPPMQRRLRLGIVGGGRGGLVGQWHWIGARLSNRWELVAGALSSKPERARASGKDWQLADDRIYTDFHAMAEAEAAREDGIEAVAICTPNWTHREIAEVFIKADIDVICDKPLALTLDDCDALEMALSGKNLVFALSYPYVYHPMVRQAREMVRLGAIGEVRQALVEYAQDWATAAQGDDNRQYAWRQDPARVGRASATGDIGTHALQLLECVSGLEVTALRADFHTCGAAKPMEDTAFMNLRLGARKVPASLWISQAAPGNHGGLTLRLYGEKGGLAWHQETPEVLRYTPLDEPEQTFVRGHGAGMLPAAERMVTLPRGHGEALSDAWGNLYREIAIAVEARRNEWKLPEDLLMVPDIATGIRGVRFVHAAADSHETGGAWQLL